VLVAVAVVDFLTRFEAAFETLRGKEAMLIDAPPFVRHRQIGAVERHNYRAIAIGIDVDAALPARVPLARRM